MEDALRLVEQSFDLDAKFSMHRAEASGVLSRSVERSKKGLVCAALTAWVRGTREALYEAAGVSASQRARDSRGTLPHQQSEGQRETT